MISRLAEIEIKHQIHHGISGGILARVLWTPLAFDMMVNVALYPRIMVNRIISLTPHATSASVQSHVQIEH
jgi:hypothetical protein